MKIAVAQGDGIGPEIMDAVLSIFKANKTPLEYEYVDMGKWVFDKGFSNGMTHGGRRAEADSAHRRLFGLLPSFLSSGVDEERLAESRAADTADRPITPSPAAMVQQAAAGIPAEKLRKLQDTLNELQECRKLLDAAVEQRSPD